MQELFLGYGREHRRRRHRDLRRGRPVRHRAPDTTAPSAPTGLTAQGSRCGGQSVNDPMQENSAGYPYDGDLWSSTAPAGNTCPNYGTPTGGKSKEGYTLYNRQWPSPAAKMFPSDLYHQCWIGNSSSAPP